MPISVVRQATVQHARQATKPGNKHQRATAALWESIRRKRERRRVKIVCQESIKIRHEHSSVLFVNQEKVRVLLLKSATSVYTADILQSLGKILVVPALLDSLSCRLDNQAALLVILDDSQSQRWKHVRCVRWENLLKKVCQTSVLFVRLASTRTLMEHTVASCAAQARKRRVPAPKCAGSVVLVCLQQVQVRSSARSVPSTCASTF